MLATIQCKNLRLLVNGLKKELEHHILCVRVAALLDDYKTWFPTGRYKTEDV